MTRHPASKQDPVPLSETGSSQDEASPDGGIQQYQEWRVLRFNEETVQSVARVAVSDGDQHGDGHLVQRADCMAFLYMKTMGAAGSLQVLVPFKCDLVRFASSGAIQIPDKIGHIKETQQSEQQSQGI